MKENIKASMQNIWCKYASHYKRWQQHNFIPSSKLIYWVAVVLFGIFYGEKVGRIIVPEWLGFWVVMSISILIGLVIRWIIGWILTLFLRNGVDELISALLIVGVVVSSVTYFSFRMRSFNVWLIGLLISGMLILFFKSLWSLVVGKLNTRFNQGVILVGSVLIIGGIWFWHTQGFEDTYIQTYLKLVPNQKRTLTVAQQESFNASIAGGPYTALSGTYDLADADLLTGTVNLTSYAQNNGLAGYIKEKYQGYNLDAVPIRGKIWYPKEVKMCPTLFIVHGNHDYREMSYLGYDYLGKYLASYGYVMVSVDENACNLLSNENDARAILLLENISALLQANQNTASFIYEKIDMQHLALAGHSRGGEAISVAYVFNNAEVNPNNGRMPLDYHFNIESLIAIAPTVDQYKPTGKSIQLEDVNYLIIHGSNDQDLYNFSGLKQYKNISFSGEGEYIKTALYCGGCNHGQFNSRWGLYDRIGIMRQVLNVKSFVSEADQQRIAEIFIKTFLDCTLKKDKTHLQLLEDYQIYAAALPKTLYIQSYQKSDFIPICNFEEDISLSTGTMTGATLDVEGGNIWTEGFYPQEALQSNSAAYLQWENGAVPTFIISTPRMNMTHRTLQFDVMNLQEDFKEADAKLLEADIIIEDATQQQAKVRLSDCATIYPAFLVRLNKLQYLTRQVEYKHQFQTVSIPNEKFKASNEKINMAQIVSLKIAFTEAAGCVTLDEIGY